MAAQSEMTDSRWSEKNRKEEIKKMEDKKETVDKLLSHFPVYQQQRATMSERGKK